MAEELSPDEQLLDRAASLIAWHFGRLAIELYSERKSGGDSWYEEAKAKQVEAQAILKAVRGRIGK